VLYGSWKNAFVGGSHEFLRNGTRLLDARTPFHYPATVVSRHGTRQVGAGSAYAYTVHDSNGDLLDGSRTYRLHVDPCRRRTSGPSTSTTPRPGLAPGAVDHLARRRQQHRDTGTLQANDDGSHDLYFGPVAPEGRETNWVETIPGKSWFQLFRIHGPLQAWFDQTWRLNEFEPTD
jgi:hypothetical protein